MKRRTFLHGLAAAAAGGVLHAGESSPPGPALTPADEIERRVCQARPLRGGPLPADLPDRLGATHYGGQYCLGSEPYLLEGCRAVLNLGMRAVKLWLAPELPGYGFHSQWNLPAGARLVDVARHPYFVEAFGLPFSTFVLEVAPVDRKGAAMFAPGASYAEDEQQLFELAAHLLAEYRDRAVTFILQHWEGDWMLRGRLRDVWARNPPEASQRAQGCVDWLAARQQGVSRARAAAGETRCRVYHAAEVNRVLDSLRGQVTVATHVLPHVAVDLVSWSSYEGRDAVRAWQGLELIRHSARPSPVFGRPVVYVGEVGFAEQGHSESEVVQWWDEKLGVYLAQEIPWILHWELYCNEPVDRAARGQFQPRRAEELRGFWLVRPDGSLSYSGKYLKLLLAHAGRKLPEGLRKAQVSS